MAKDHNEFAASNLEVQKKVHERLVSTKPVGGRTTEEESRVEQALAEHIAGATKYSVEKKYDLASGKIDRFIKQRFPNPDDYYEFLESAMMQNAALAMDQFVQKVDELAPDKAASAASTFARTAIEIRKARTNGFKESTVPVAVLLRLEQALTLNPS